MKNRFLNAKASPLLGLRRQKSIFEHISLHPYSASGGKNRFVNAIASTYSASGGKNQFLNVTFRMQNGKFTFFRLLLQRWGLARKKEREIWCK